MFFIVFEDDLIDNREKTITRLFSFLGVEQDENINLDVSGNKSSPPSVKRVRDKPVYYVNKGQKQQLPRGTILFTTGFPGIDRVIVNPSQRTTMYFNKLHKNMTRQLDGQVADKMLQQYFSGDIERLETMIDRDLSVWYGQTG